MHIDELDPRAPPELRRAVEHILQYIAADIAELFVAIVNLAIANGVSIGIDEMRAALKSGDPDHG